MIRLVAYRLFAVSLLLASLTTHANTIKIPLSGTGEVPSSFGLSVNPALLENGEITVGNQKTQQFTITHTGNADSQNIEILSVEVGGQDSYDFSADYAGYNTLNAGSTIDFSVTFTPVTLGYKKAFLRIEHSGENSPHLVLMTGVGIDVPASELRITDNNLDFGTIEVDLNPGQSVNIVTTMTSTIAGQKAAQLVIDHDGSNPTVRVNLQGAVQLPPEPGTDTDPGTDNFTGIPNTDPNALTSPDSITNHNDDGTVNNAVDGRLVTGILVAGTAARPEIFVASADPRMAAGPSGNDSNLDTNSVIISKLTRNGKNWAKNDIVRGLPRSEENHVGNGMQLSANGNTLYIAMGGHTNMGRPSNNFAGLPEYALSAAIVEIDLNQIGDNTYDLPTLDDEDRAGVDDSNDPFGGNNGKNMAILDNNSPVSIYAPGFRNSYDLLLTDDGRMYTVDLAATRTRPAVARKTHSMNQTPSHR